MLKALVCQEETASQLPCAIAQQPGLSKSRAAGVLFGASMANSLESVFDVMNGLEWPTNALALPLDIIKVENEHEHAVAVISYPVPILPLGLEIEVGERAQDTGQHPPQLDPQADHLARALENFQELDRVQFGVSSRNVSSAGIRVDIELPEDYYSSEDESNMEEPPSAGGLPNPSLVPDLDVHNSRPD